MSRPTTCKAYGKEYRSYNALAKEYGINAVSLTRRIHIHGMTVEEAIEDILEKQKKSEYKRSGPIVLHGVRYNSINDACNKLNVCFSFVRLRLDRGMSVEEAFSRVPSSSNRFVIYDGEWFSSLGELCQVKNVSYANVYQRAIRRKTHTIEEAIAIELQQSEK